MLLIRIILFAVVATCSGCIPLHVQQTPHITGAVFDQTSRKPILGAVIHYQAYPKHLVGTSADGQFDFPAIYRWELVPLIPSDRYARQHLIADADGHQSAELDYGEMGYGGWHVITNQIFLLKPQ